MRCEYRFGAPPESGETGMRHATGNRDASMKRQRGRGNRRPGGGNPNRSFESNGPDMKVRGSAQHIYERYVQLARDAHSSGDRVLAENYMQHADHYYRVLRAMQPSMPPPPAYDAGPADFDIDGDGEDEGDEEGAEAEAEAPVQNNGGGQYRQDRPERQDRPDRGERFDRRDRRDRDRDRGDRPDRGERPRFERPARPEATEGEDVPPAPQAVGAEADAPPAYNPEAGDAGEGAGRRRRRRRTSRGEGDRAEGDAGETAPFGGEAPAFLAQPVAVPEPSVD